MIILFIILLVDNESNIILNVIVAVVVRWHLKKGFLECITHVYIQQNLSKSISCLDHLIQGDGIIGKLIPQIVCLHPKTLKIHLFLFLCGLHIGCVKTRGKMWKHLLPQKNKSILLLTNYLLTLTPWLSAWILYITPQGVIIYDTIGTWNL